MIVKILSASASFGGISYNTDKIDNGKGELMAVKNFGALQGLMNLRPEDYKNYLKMISATNKAVKKPQFHAAISAEGRTYDKHQLTEIAHEWLAKMGYGDQPYLVVFHKDTANNHVHIITTRIDRRGKKINSGFENVRALHNLSRVLGIDEKHNAKQDIEKALSYHYVTKAQFMMILECQGYKLIEKDGEMQAVKFGKVQGKINVSAIIESIAQTEVSTQRVAQLKALLFKYAPHYDTAGLTEYLKSKHGIVLLFHAKDGKPAYGYTIIDHSGKAVYKGGEIMPLPKLLELNAAAQPAIAEAKEVTYEKQVTEPDRRDYYKALLKAALYNYPDIGQGLHHTGIGIYLRDDCWYLVDHSGKAFIPLDQLLNSGTYSKVMQAFAASGEVSTEIDRQHVFVPDPIISADVDDEAIYGRKRRKNKRNT